MTQLSGPLLDEPDDPELPELLLEESEVLLLLDDPEDEPLDEPEDDDDHELELEP